MNSYIYSIATRVPGEVYPQDCARDCMLGWVSEPRARRAVSVVYNRSAIERRYSVLPDFKPDALDPLFRSAAGGGLIEPSTGARNRVYRREAPALFAETARDALAAADMEPGAVTHVVTVSCTGFYSPGPDLDIVTRLGLPQTVERYHLGFMGCYAAFPALRMAHQFCTANPEAVVLIVCVELCTLHLQIREDMDSLLANSLFADGAAAAVVCARSPRRGARALALEQFMTTVAPNSAADMAWEVGDRGFRMTLSSYVPDVIATHIGEVTDAALACAGRSRDEIAWWAVHPGGKAILDKVERQLHLEPSRLEPSREVLREFGNMSSATVLFVLHRLLERTEATAESPVHAMAFGPGLTIESATLRLLGAAAHDVSATEQAEEARR